MDVQVRRREGEEVASERCPYCHDLIGGVASGELIPCPGCGTTHHEACLAEIGRCTIHGCGLEVDAPTRARFDARRGDAHERVTADHSAAYREIRRRMRDRARTWVRDHCRQAPTPRGSTLPDLVAAIRDARDAMAFHGWQHAAQEYDEALRLFHVLGVEVVDVDGRRVARWQLTREAEQAHREAVRGAGGEGDMSRLALDWLVGIGLTLLLAIPAWLVVSRFIL